MNLVYKKPSVWCDVTTYLEVHEDETLHEEPTRTILYKLAFMNPLLHTMKPRLVINIVNSAQSMTNERKASSCDQSHLFYYYPAQEEKAVKAERRWRTVRRGLQPADTRSSFVSGVLIRRAIKGWRAHLKVLWLLLALGKKIGKKQQGNVSLSL